MRLKKRLAGLRDGLGENDVEWIFLEMSKEVSHSKIFSCPLLGGGKYHSTLKKPGYGYSDFYKYQSKLQEDNQN